ncbi:MAG TPA: hypothetical protein VMW87_03810 [Spirochaetia bacterium]|nr:hypothetical protein [Spirochaetia bacterium]
MPRIVYSPEHEKFQSVPVYNPRTNALEPHPDDPARVGLILEALEDLSWPVIRETGDYNLDPYLGLHSYEMISLFREVDNGISAGMLNSPVVAAEFAGRHASQQPESLDGRLGWFCTDVRTPLTAGSWAAACGSLSATIAGADLLMGGERLVYVIARPGGHHAGRDFFGGGSYLNHAAGAGVHLSRRARVAVLDIGFHHGNGTQDIFYESREIGFVSIHVDPRAVYPHFCGYADENGDGKARGGNRNLPLHLPLTPKEFGDTVDRAVGELRRMRPEALVISLSANIATEGGNHLPIPGMNLPISVYADAATRIGKLNVPMLVVQEEGDDRQTLGPSVRGFVEALWAVLSKHR